MTAETLGRGVGCRQQLGRHTCHVTMSVVRLVPSLSFVSICMSWAPRDGAAKVMMSLMTRQNCLSSLSYISVFLLLSATKT